MVEVLLEVPLFGLKLLVTCYQYKTYQKHTFLLNKCNKIVFLLSTPSYEEKENDPKQNQFMTNKWSVSYNDSILLFS